MCQHNKQVVAYDENNETYEMQEYIIIIKSIG